MEGEEVKLDESMEGLRWRTRWINGGRREQLDEVMKGQDEEAMKGQDEEVDEAMKGEIGKLDEAMKGEEKN